MKKSKKWLLGKNRSIKIVIMLIVISFVVGTVTTLADYESEQLDSDLGFSQMILDISENDSNKQLDADTPLGLSAPTTVAVSSAIPAPAQFIVHNNDFSLYLFEEAGTPYIKVVNGAGFTDEQGAEVDLTDTIYTYNDNLELLVGSGEPTLTVATIDTSLSSEEQRLGGDFKIGRIGRDDAADPDANFILEINVSNGSILTVSDAGDVRPVIEGLTFKYGSYHSNIEDDMPKGTLIVENTSTTTTQPLIAMDNEIVLQNDNLKGIYAGKGTILDLGSTGSMRLFNNMTTNEFYGPNASVGIFAGTVGIESAGFPPELYPDIYTTLIVTANGANSIGIDAENFSIFNGGIVETTGTVRGMRIAQEALINGGTITATAEGVSSASANYDDWSIGLEVAVVVIEHSPGPHQSILTGIGEDIGLLSTSRIAASETHIKGIGKEKAGILLLPVDPSVSMATLELAPATLEGVLKGSGTTPFTILGVTFQPAGVIIKDVEHYIIYWDGETRTRAGRDIRFGLRGVAETSTQQGAGVRLLNTMGMNLPIEFEFSALDVVVPLHSNGYGWGYETDHPFYFTEAHSEADAYPGQLIERFTQTTSFDMLAKFPFGDTGTDLDFFAPWSTADTSIVFEKTAGGFVAESTGGPTVLTATYTEQEGKDIPGSSPIIHMQADAQHIIEYQAAMFNDEVTINLDAQSGSVSSSTLVTRYNHPLTGVPIPMREGHEFKGWFTQANGVGVEYIEGKTSDITTPITLYAFWEIQSYMVTFVPGRGVLPSSATAIYDYDMLIADPLVSAPKGYRFDGWFTDGDIQWNFASDTMPARNITLTAKWSVDPNQKVTVSFDVNGGKGTTANQTLNVEDRVTEPTGITRFGYKLVSWTQTGIPWNFDSALNSDNFQNFTLVAQWERDTAVKVIFNFDLQGGKGNAPAQTLYVDDRVAQPEIPVRFGYTFDGWFKTDNIQWDFSSVLAESNFESTTLYARWSIDPNVFITVRYDSRGEQTYPNEKYNVEALVSQPQEPTRYGYLFSGWSLDKQGKQLWNFTTDRISAVDQEIILYGNWRGNPDMLFPIHFVTSGGAPMPATQKLMADSLVSRPEDPIRKNKDFTGWYKNRNLTIPWDFQTDMVPALDAGITLYAKYRSNTPGSNKQDVTPPTIGGGSFQGGGIGATDFWDATNELMIKEQSSGDTWKIAHDSYAKPQKLSARNRMIIAVPGPNLKMPSYVLNTLESQKSRTLQLEMGEGYNWHFDSNSLETDQAVQFYSITVANSQNKAVRSLVGENRMMHQFKIGHTGSWQTEARLEVEVSDPTLAAAKQLYVYSYNAKTKVLDYVGKTLTTGNGLHMVTIPTTGGSSLGEYVLSSVLFKDAVVLGEIEGSTSDNPNTGGYLVEDLIRDKLIAEPDVELAVQNTPNPSLWWMSVLALPIIGIVVFLKKREDSNN